MSMHHLAPAGLLIAMLSLQPWDASAQEAAAPAPNAEAPLIALPPASEEPAAVPTGPDPALSADTPATDSPAEDAAAAGTVEAEPVQDGTGTGAPPLPHPLPAPIARDGGVRDSGAMTGWLFRPRPEGQLPDGVQVGPSLVSPGVIRLTGETASIRLVLDLPAGVPAEGPLNLTIRSSLNLLPELSQMQVQVNDAPPVAIKLDQLEGFAAVPIPTTALVGGSNRIQLTLRQPHRIFCGPEATFGVWTEIALDQSGVRLPDATLPSDAAGFALAVQSQTAGGRSLTLLAAEDDDPVLVRALADRLRLALGPSGRVELRSFYALGPEPLASVALISSDRARASYRRGAGGGIVLQVEHRAGEVPDLTPMLAPLEARAVSPVTPALMPGRPTTLAELGAGDTLGNTYYFRRDITFGLPTDWLLMANQKARLDLHYGFAKGLPTGAILLVKINGETVRLLPLDREGGDVLPPLPIGFNANLLRPGRNHLTFEMMVPGDPPTEVCPVRRSDMLVVLADSLLTVPPSPAMLLPGLTTALQRLDPGAVIAVPGAIEARGLEAVVQQIAGELDAGPAPSTTVRLQVASLNDLPLVPLESAGLTAGVVQNLLFPAPAAAEPPKEEAAPARAAFRLTDEEEAAPAEVPAEDGFISRIWNNISPQDWILREIRLIKDSAFIGSNQRLRDWLVGRSGTALLLRPDFEQRGELWLILGPEANPLVTGAALNRLREDGLAQGEAALLGSDGNWQIWSPIRPPRLLDAPDARSIRTVIGNYASWSPFLFTLSMLVLALLSALPALLYVLLSRREGGSA